MKKELFVVLYILFNIINVASLFVNGIIDWFFMEAIRNSICHRIFTINAIILFVNILIIAIISIIKRIKER